LELLLELLLRLLLRLTLFNRLPPQLRLQLSPLPPADKDQTADSSEHAPVSRHRGDGVVWMFSSATSEFAQDYFWDRDL